MLPLGIQVQANLAKLSWIVAAKNFGFMVAVVGCGLVFPSTIKDNSELILVICYLLPAIGNFLF